MSIDKITRSALPQKKIEYSEFMLAQHPNRIIVIERVLFLDPAELYARIGHLINPHKRHAGIQMEQLFPKIEGRCACGCDQIPDHSDEKSQTKWFRKWATDQCSSFASDVLSIINNYFGKPAKYISFYYGKKCSQCEETYNLELDHIIGVKHGGGGCWLSNYRWLCATHHRQKTNSDFGFNPNQTKMKIIDGSLTMPQQQPDPKQTVQPSDHQ